MKQYRCVVRETFRCYHFPPFFLFSLFFCVFLEGEAPVVSYLVKLADGLGSWVVSRSKLSQRELPKSRSVGFKTWITSPALPGRTSLKPVISFGAGCKVDGEK